MTGRGTPTVALVESATQLLNVVEWAHLHDAVHDVQVVVLCPRDRYARQQLTRVGALAVDAGVEVVALELRSLAVRSVVGGLRLTRDVSRAARLVVGDPFSGLIQTLLPLVRAEQIVVVDDGTATWEFADCVNGDRPLVRWDRRRSGAPHRAVRSTRQLSPTLERELTVFSCLDGATPVGAHHAMNSYTWTRTGWIPEIRHAETAVVGSSLVETGIVERAAYLDAVRRLTCRSAQVRYLAHRRESDNRLAEIAALPGVRVERTKLPVELALRRGPLPGRVITFPSTAAHTLPVVLGDLDVRLEVRRIDADWFTPATTRHARDFVTRIADEAPVRPVLEIA